MMDRIARVSRAALLAACAAIVSLASSTAAERLSGRRLVQALQAGGHVIYFRHFETGADYADQHLVKLEDCATQRQVNEAGVRDAVRVRDAFQALKLPVSETVASPFCRSWQSADLAFGSHWTVEGLKLPPSKDYTDADTAAMRAATRSSWGMTTICRRRAVRPLIGISWNTSKGWQGG